MKFLKLEIPLLGVLCLLCSFSNAQLRTIDVNLIPGLGTTGLNHDRSRNAIALNIFSGYCDRTTFLQISGISGTNRTYSSGLHLAGVANITGANLKSMDENFKKELLPIIQLNGLQLAGLVNIVRGAVSGGQIAGVFNFSERELIGVQIAGLANYVGGYALGTQIGLFANKTALGMGGVQISIGKNTAGGELSGIQAGLFNEAEEIHGKNGAVKDRTGLQLGLINKTKGFNGFQIGLLNVAGKSGGTQIGLINWYKPASNQGNTKNGTAIGLINIGELVYFSATTNELFAFNYEIATGNIKNARSMGTKFYRYVTNSIMFSHDPFSNHIFGVGYALKKLHFNRSTTPGKSESKFFGYGANVRYVKQEKQESKDPSAIVSGIELCFGKRLLPKLSGVNMVLTLSQNFTSNSSFEPKYSIAQNSISLLDQSFKTWTGLSLGVLFH